MTQAVQEEGTILATVEYDGGDATLTLLARLLEQHLIAGKIARAMRRCKKLQVLSLAYELNFQILVRSPKGSPEWKQALQTEKELEQESARLRKDTGIK